MYNVKKVLVPLDGSACSFTALERALSLAGQLSAEVITVYHVADMGSFTRDLRVSSDGGSTTIEEYAARAGQVKLSEWLARVPADVRSRLDVQVEVGRPRDCILRKVRDGKYDLLVMGTHGRTGRVHALAGSIAESVVRMCACPVLTVREDD